MKRVGILTIHNSPNYGASLQTFALYKYVEMQGCQVEMIDLHRPFAHEDFVPSKKYKPSRKVKVSLKSRIKQLMKKLLRMTDAAGGGNGDAYSLGAARRFEEFNSAMKLSCPFRSVDELYANPPQYDLYIAGSDQLWNPTQQYCIEPYFLTFVPDNQAKKISFATSIGITELTNREKTQFKRWLSSFDDVSVREKQAKQLLDTFVGREIHQVADPTFLLDQAMWKSLAVHPLCKKPYILMFTLYPQPRLIEYSARLSKESGLDLIVLGQNQTDAGDGDNYIVVKDAGPKEFMGYIGDAELVITDSFHCTVFSLIMGSKNVYSYIDTNNNRGSRIIDLLTTFGLETHLLHPDLTDTYQHLAETTVKASDISDYP